MLWFDTKLEKATKNWNWWLVANRDRTMLGVEEVVPHATHGQEGVIGDGGDDEIPAVTGAQGDVWHHIDSSRENIYSQKVQERGRSEHRVHWKTSRLRRAGSEDRRSAAKKGLAVASMNGCSSLTNSTETTTARDKARATKVAPVGNEVGSSGKDKSAQEVFTPKAQAEGRENNEVQLFTTKPVEKVLNGHLRADSKSEPNGRIQQDKCGGQLKHCHRADIFAEQDLAAKRKATPPANENFDHCSPPKKRYTSYLARGHVVSAVPQGSVQSGQHTSLTSALVHTEIGQFSSPPSKDTSYQKSENQTSRTQAVNLSVREVLKSQTGANSMMYPEAKATGMEQPQPGGLVFTPFQPTIQIEVPAVLMFPTQQMPLSLPEGCQQVSGQPVITLNSGLTEYRTNTNGVISNVHQMMLQNMPPHQLPVEARVTQEATPLKGVQPQILSFEIPLKCNQMNGINLPGQATSTAASYQMAAGIGQTTLAVAEREIMPQTDQHVEQSEQVYTSISYQDCPAPTSSTTETWTTPDRLRLNGTTVIRNGQYVVPHKQGESRLPLQKRHYYDRNPLTKDMLPGQSPNVCQVIGTQGTETHFDAFNSDMPTRKRFRLDGEAATPRGENGTPVKYRSAPNLLSTTTNMGPSYNGVDGRNVCDEACPVTTRLDAAARRKSAETLTQQQPPFMITANKLNGMFQSPELDIHSIMLETHVTKQQPVEMKQHPIMMPNNPQYSPGQNGLRENSHVIGRNVQHLLLEKNVLNQSPAGQMTTEALVDPRPCQATPRPYQVHWTSIARCQQIPHQNASPSHEIHLNPGEPSYVAQPSSKNNTSDLYKLLNAPRNQDHGRTQNRFPSCTPPGTGSLTATPQSTPRASPELQYGLQEANGDIHRLLLPRTGPMEQVRVEKLCVVCRDQASGLHYGAMACEGCKGFFKRTVQNRRLYACVRGDYKCEVMMQKRNLCQGCRLRRCMRKGMMIAAVREDRVPGGRAKRKRREWMNKKQDVAKEQPASPDQETGHGVHNQDGAMTGKDSPTSHPVASNSRLVQELLACEEPEVNFKNDGEATEHAHILYDLEDGRCHTAHAIQNLGNYLVARLVRWLKMFPFQDKFEQQDLSRLLSNKWMELTLMDSIVQPRLYPRQRDDVTEMPRMTLMQRIYYNELRLQKYLATSKGSTLNNNIRDNGERRKQTDELTDILERLHHVTTTLRKLHMSREEYVILKAMVLLNQDGPLETTPVLYQLLDELCLTENCRADPSRLESLLVRLPELTTAAIIVKEEDGRLPFFLDALLCR